MLAKIVANDATGTYYKCGLCHLRSLNGMTGLASRCILGSWDLQPLRTTHLPSLQDNMSCAGSTLLEFSQWEGEKEGRPFGGARRMNAATQTAGQLTDDR
jgi:hypothetical protein